MRLILLLPVLIAGAAHAGVLDRERATGDWGGGRAALEERGIAFELAYTAEMLSNVSGGVRTETEALATIDVALAADLGRLVRWRGATLFVYGLGNHGGNPSDHVGDVQGVSNIEAVDTFKLYEVWLDQTFFGGRASLLVGLFDVNSEFDVIPGASLFVHSSHGIGAEFGTSCRNGPSIFPTTSLSARFAMELTDAVTLRAVVADGVAGDPDDPQGTQIRFDDGDGALIVAEAAWTVRLADDRTFAKYALGGWGYTADFEDPIGETHARTGGVYALAQRRVFNEDTDLRQGLTVFARTGVARERGNAVDRYVGGGAVYRGVFAAADLAGLAVAAARPIGGGLDWEVAFEGAYSVPVAPWLAAQAFTQYIANPGGEPNREDAVTFGLRVGVTL